VAAVSGSEACQPQAGSTFNGFLEGSPLPVWTNGLSGFGLSFDGVQNQIRIGCRKDAQDAQTGTSSCVFCDFSRPTVSAWVKAAAGITGEIVALWSTNGLAQGSFMLSLTNGVPCFELRVNGANGSSPQRRGEGEEVGTYHAVLGTSGRTDGQWHFVAGSYDGREMRVWWDGKQDGGKSVTGTIESVDAPIQIGLIAAVVDEVSIFGRGLTAGELEGLWQTKGAFTVQGSAVGTVQGAGSAADTAAATTTAAMDASTMTILTQGAKGIEAFTAAMMLQNPQDVMGLMPRISVSGLTTMQVGAPNTRPTVQPGSYAERRARELDALYAAMLENPRDAMGMAARIPVTGLTTMQVGAPNTRPKVRPGGYAEKRAKELDTIHAAMIQKPRDDTGLAARIPLAGLTTMQVGAPNTRPTVQPGGYAEARAAEMEAIAAEMARLLGETIYKPQGY